ncbi:MAG: metallophosphoesterase [Acidobacteriota bacterium]
MGDLKTGKSRLSRRGFLRLAAAGGMTGGLLGGTWLYGRKFEIEWWQLESVRLALPELPEPLQGFRILLLSDFHLYPHVRLEYLREVIHAVADLRPDLAVFTGDFVQGTADAIHDLAPLLATVNARHGNFCVIGNHDIWKGREVVEPALRREGLGVLVNQGLSLSHDGASLYLAGVDDLWSGNPDLPAAMAGWRGERTVVLLSHEPDPADQYSQDPRIQLQLSGHSHGGQVRIPGLGSPFLPPYGRKYDQGWFQVRTMQLYVNRGIGVTVPIRLYCRPEATLLELVREPQTAARGARPGGSPLRDRRV